MLQLPRQHLRLTGIDRRPALEDLYDPRRADRACHEQCRRAVDGTFGRVGVVVAYLRCGKRHDLCDYSDNYSDPPTQTSDAILGLNAVFGKIGLGAAGDAWRCIQCGVCVQPARVKLPQAKGRTSILDHPRSSSGLPSGKRALIAGQKSGVVTAVDPDRKGEFLWQTRVGDGRSLGGVQWGSAADGNKIYLAVSDTKFSVVPPGTPGAQTSQFDWKVAWLLDRNTGGGLHALRLESGEEVCSGRSRLQ